MVLLQLVDFMFKLRGGLQFTDDFLIGLSMDFALRLFGFSARDIGLYILNAAVLLFELDLVPFQTEFLLERIILFLLVGAIVLLLLRVIVM
jgi:hypothetical protein